MGKKHKTLFSAQADVFRPRNVTTHWRTSHLLSTSEDHDSVKDADLTLDSTRDVRNNTMSDDLEADLTVDIDSKKSNTNHGIGAAIDDGEPHAADSKTDTLAMSENLQSQDTKDLLDLIDRLRSQGLSKYVDLPQIIVCGEQSAGKSSVLEAISGLTFPSKDNLCTRFATELILRRSPVDSMQISIVPESSEAQSPEELRQLQSFTTSRDKIQPFNLASVIERATKAMGIADGIKSFSSHTLKIELSGADLPNLSLVDLPGLFQSGSRTQSLSDSETVEKMVLRYMKKPRSIILAVVSAKTDCNNQVITKHAQSLDPKGLRTLGLITKPDTLDEGSDMQSFYVNLAQNKEIFLQLGWHVLRNRTYHERDHTLQERTVTEEEFFTRGVWRSLDSEYKGVLNLKPRLSSVLKDQIVNQLPSLKTQVEELLKDCAHRLGRLGQARATTQEQRKYLFEVVQQYNMLMRAAVKGDYAHEFFGELWAKSNYRKRLRAVIQNTLTDFTEKMITQGHVYRILEDKSPKRDQEFWGKRFGQSDDGNGEDEAELDDRSVLNDLENADDGVTTINRGAYMDKVEQLLKNSRGRELPGLYDPLIVGVLFSEQSRRWPSILSKFATIMLDAVSHVIRSILDYAADAETIHGIMIAIINPQFDSIRQEFEREIAKILDPHRRLHPITYNHYLTETVQKIQADRRKADLKKGLEKVLGNVTVVPSHQRFAVETILNELSISIESNMNRYAASSATDMMEAYYKVALKNIIDDFSVLAIEQCLIQKLPEIISPNTVFALSDEQIQRIAGESEVSVAERKRLTEKQRVLTEGLASLRMMEKVGVDEADE